MRSADSSTVFPIMRVMTHAATRGPFRGARYFHVLVALRGTIARDRRVKLVVLTPRGARTRETILREFCEPPPELTTLEARELDTLLEILAKLTAATHGHGRK